MDLEELAPLLVQCPYPPTLAYVDRGIRGRGYYPAAEGFHNADIPLGGMMLLGRDWGTKVQYDRWEGEPARDETALTWRHTTAIHLHLLQGIPIWCTNYLLGVRIGVGAVGNIRDQVEPVAWSKFERYCWMFLQRQVLLQRPKLVVVLGQFNREDMESSHRLGVHDTEFFQHTFLLGMDSHTAMVTYSDHPHSLIAKSAKERAREHVKRMRAVYEQGNRMFAAL